MNNKSDKMDRQGARTVADLELKFNMGKSFAEAVGITDPSRMTLEDAKKVLTRLAENLNSVTASVTATAEGLEEAKAQLVLAIQYDSEGKPYAVISEKADYIELTGTQIRISSDHFTLDKNGAWFSGVITAAIIGNGNVQLNDSCVEFYSDDAVKIGSLDSKATPSGGFVNATGKYRFTDRVNFEGDIGLGQDHSITMNGVSAKTGWLKYQHTITDARYMHFINGLLVEETNDSNGYDNGIKLN